MRTNKKKNSSSKTYGSYWFTPSAWKHPCGRGCGSGQSVAYRRSDRSYVCAQCIERLGIKPRASKAWQDGGAGTDPSVRISYMDPKEMKQ